MTLWQYLDIKSAVAILRAENMKNAQIIWSLKGGKTVGGSGESNWR